jgi:hypothetical protein
MSLQQTLEAGSTYQVVGTRPTGERVVISKHVDPCVAEQILSLIQSTGSYSDIFIEVDGKRLSAPPDGWTP